MAAFLLRRLGLMILTLFLLSLDRILRRPDPPR